MTNGPILVTGGTGFVGRAIVRALAAAGHGGRVLSRAAGAAADPRFQVVRGDLGSARDVAEAMRGCTAVFHCAAEKTDAARMAAVNVEATRRLVDAAREAGVVHFCHLSSVGVIGRTDRRVVDEATPCRPMNSYEVTKLAAEAIAAEGLAGGRVVILRPTNVFGAETIAPLLDRSLRARARLVLTGNERAHFVYVKDVADTAVRLFDEPRGPAVASYIVSSDEEAGNTHREIQRFLHERHAAAPPPPPFCAPQIVPYVARLVRHRVTNRGHVVYSGASLREAGVRFAYGLHGGLDDALRSALGTAAGATTAPRFARP